MEHGAVDLDEGPVGPAAHGVDGLGDRALAYSRLAGYQNVRLGVGRVLHQGIEPLHGRALNYQTG